MAQRPRQNVRGLSSQVPTNSQPRTGRAATSGGANGRGARTRSPNNAAASATGGMRNYAITDEGSFDAVTGRDHELAGLYAWAELDNLIDLAHLVSVDFFARPEYYKRFDDQAVVERIALLNGRYGCD